MPDLTWLRDALMGALTPLRNTSARSRVHALVIALCVAAVVFHQHYNGIGRWYIEDAAIDFAYARNFINGEGLVPFVGGERVEGYSNALWVLLLAIGELFGYDGFASSKLMADVFAGVTVVTSYFIARHALDDHEGQSEGSLLAPILLASYSQFAIWNASGLENSLFNLLLALILWRTLVEARDNRFPWSAVLCFLLSTTRPDGILYCALVGFWAMVIRFQAGHGVKPTMQWLGMFWLPWGVYNAWRVWYFAWFFPNTFYAKEKFPDLWNYNHFTWKYVRNWAQQLWTGVMVPLALLGVLGSRRWRGWLAVGVILLYVGVFTYPSNALTQGFSWWPTLPAPSWWNTVRIGTTLVLATLLVVPAMGSRGWRARVMLWGCGCLSVFFSLYAGADWMKGFRWFSLLSVPYAVLLAVGVCELSEWAQRRVSGSSRWQITGWLVASLVGTLLIPPSLQYTMTWSKRKETGPFSVRKRANYTQSVRKRLHMEERPRVWDVDQGAHLFWTDFWMVDMGGLVDVSVGHHDFEKPFMKEYMFTERQPHFAHVHGGWASRTKILTYPEWKRDYLELPGFPAGKKAFHIGNYVRRDLIMRPSWEGPAGREVPFADGITLAGWDIPSPEVARGRVFYLEVGLSVAQRRRTALETFRVVAFASNQDGSLVHSWELPPAYDWIGPESWDQDVAVGKFSLMLPKRLGPGSYDIGFVVFDHTGAVVPAAPESGDQPVSTAAILGGRGDTPARFAVGEVRFADALIIGSLEDRARAAKADRVGATRAARDGHCDQAVHSWWLARMHRPLSAPFVKEFGPPVKRAIAACYARRAESEPDTAVDSLQAARELDHWEPTYLRVATTVANRLFAEGLDARAAGDAEAAYRAFYDCLRVDTTRSWARRYAEEMRDERLGLDRDARKQKTLDRQRRQRELREKRQKAKAERTQRAKDAKTKGPKGPKGVDALRKAAKLKAIRAAKAKTKTKAAPAGP